jgi:hypothetical protein
MYTTMLARRRRVWGNPALRGVRHVENRGSIRVWNESRVRTLTVEETTRRVPGLRKGEIPDADRTRSGGEVFSAEGMRSR